MLDEPLLRTYGTLIGVSTCQRNGLTNFPNDKIFKKDSVRANKNLNIPPTHLVLSSPSRYVLSKQVTTIRTYHAFYFSPLLYLLIPVPHLCTRYLLIWFLFSRDVSRFDKPSFFTRVNRSKRQNITRRHRFRREIIPIQPHISQPGYFSNKISDYEQQNGWQITGRGWKTRRM